MLRRLLYRIFGFPAMLAKAGTTAFKLAEAETKVATIKARRKAVEAEAKLEHLALEALHELIG